MKYPFVFLVFLFFSASFAFAETIVVLSGLPQVKVMSDFNGTEQVQMSESEQANYRCEIVKKGNDYYWASRKDMGLIYSESGTFYNFVEPGGSGYIRVVVADGATYYMEHLTLGLKNITYWGSAAEFTP